MKTHYCSCWINVSGAHGLSLPTNLCPYKRITNLCVFMYIMLCKKKTPVTQKVSSQLTIQHNFDKPWAPININDSTIFWDFSWGPGRCSWITEILLVQRKFISSIDFFFQFTFLINSYLCDKLFGMWISGFRMRFKIHKL